MIIVLGRGHSGTRALSYTLLGSGVSLGPHINETGDSCPAVPMYRAVVMAGERVKYVGDYQWDFSDIMGDPPKEFVDHIDRYTSDIKKMKSPNGWKLPETILAAPWIIKMFPDAHYIHWVRDPRDSIMGPHGTDRLDQYAVAAPECDGIEQRAISWKYQHDLCLAAPAPKNSITIRFEDFINYQDDVLGALQDFLGIPMAKVVVNRESIGRWRKAKYNVHFEFLRPLMKEYNYAWEA